MSGNVCRICLEGNFETRYTVFDIIAEDSILTVREFLKTFTDIVVNENDGLSKFICWHCSYLIECAFNLYKLCNESQKYLNTLLHVSSNVNMNEVEEINTESEINTELEINNLEHIDLPPLNFCKNESMENSDDLKVTVVVKEEPEKIIKTKMVKKYGKLETDPNVKRKFDYTGTYVEKTREDGKVSYECTKCNKHLFNCRLYDFKRHYELHLEPFYRCKYCKRIFCKQYSYKCHLEIAHKIRMNTPPMKVKVNMKKKAKSLKLPKPIKVTESDRKPGELETNPNVKRTVDFRGTFNIHQNGSKKRFECNECGKLFDHLRYFKTHYEQHLDIFYICTQCQKTFSVLRLFKAHLECHSGKEYTCALCGKTYKTRQGILDHNNVHKNIRYKCNVCDKSFQRRGELHVHKRFHSGVRNYVCPYCGASFITNSNLRAHERIHTGKKPHQCNQCDKAFIASHCLKKHMLTHMDDPPLIHKCDQCDKSFKTRSSLRQHEQSHMEKRFQCTVCLKKFTQRHSLKSHMRICPGLAK